MNKWILIEVQDNEILEPDICSDYSEAYDKMEKRYKKLDDGESCNHIYPNEAYIQTDTTNISWKIFEVS